MKNPAFTFQNTELCQWLQSIPSIHFKTIEGITLLSVLLKPCCLVVKALLTPDEISHSCSPSFLRPLPVQCWETGYNSNRLQALERARELPSPQSVHTLSLNPHSIRGEKNSTIGVKLAKHGSGEPLAECLLQLRVAFGSGTSQSKQKPCYSI